MVQVGQTVDREPFGESALDDHVVDRLTEDLVVQISAHRVIVQRELTKRRLHSVTVEKADTVQSRWAQKVWIHLWTPITVYKNVNIHVGKNQKIPIESD